MLPAPTAVRTLLLSGVLLAIVPLFACITVGVGSDEQPTPEFGAEVPLTETYSDETIAIVQRSAEAFDRGDAQEGRRLFEEAQRAHGEPSAGLEILGGHIYLQLGDYEAAVRHYTNAIEISDDAFNRNTRAYAHYLHGHCDLAIPDAEAALTMEPVSAPGFHSSVEANIALGNCRSQGGDRRTGLSHYESALALMREHGYPAEKIADAERDIALLKEDLGD